MCKVAAAITIQTTEEQTTLEVQIQELSKQIMTPHISRRKSYKVQESEIPSNNRLRNKQEEDKSYYH